MDRKKYELLWKLEGLHTVETAAEKLGITRQATLNLLCRLKTENFRVILASLHLFKHIKNWPRLYRMAKEKNCWQKVGALYDVARLFMRVHQIGSRYLKVITKKWVALTQLRKKNFPEIAGRWKVYIPFNEHDMVEL